MIKIDDLILKAKEEILKHNAISWKKDLMEELESYLEPIIEKDVLHYNACIFAQFIKDGIRYEDENEDDYLNCELVQSNKKPTPLDYINWDAFCEEYTGSLKSNHFDYRIREAETYGDYIFENMIIFDSSTHVKRFFDKHLQRIKKDFVFESSSLPKRIKNFSCDNAEIIMESFSYEELFTLFDTEIQDEVIHNLVCDVSCDFNYDDMVKLYEIGCDELSKELITMELCKADVQKINFYKDLLIKCLPNTINHEFYLNDFKQINSFFDKIKVIKDTLNNALNQDNKEDYMLAIRRSIFKYNEYCIYLDSEKSNRLRNSYNELNEKLSELKILINDGLETLALIYARISATYNLDDKAIFEHEDCCNKLYDYNPKEIFDYFYIDAQLKTKVRPFISIDPKYSFPIARKLNRHFIIHLGETNTGKTYNAMCALKQANTGMYLAPLRLLALENQEKLLNHGCKCNLLTGEEEALVESATHLSATVEKCDFNHIVDVCVIDECQFICDEDRGWAWTNAILGAPASTIHLCAAPYAEKILIKLIKSCGDSYEIIHHKRTTQLVVEPKSTGLSKIKEGDAIVVFSKKQVLNIAAELDKNGIHCSVIYGALPYETRKKQFENFLAGKTKVIVATDAIGLGVNLPIQRILFGGTEKYDGKRQRELTSQEVKQIAGRAGRMGMYDIGYVTTLQGDNKFVAQKLDEHDEMFETARLHFPEKLIEVDEDLDVLLKTWYAMADYSFYDKSQVERSITLLFHLKTFQLTKKRTVKINTDSFR